MIWNASGKAPPASADAGAPCNHSFRSIAHSEKCGRPRPEPGHNFLPALVSCWNMLKSQQLLHDLALFRDSPARTG